MALVLRDGARAGNAPTPASRPKANDDVKSGEPNATKSRTGNAQSFAAQSGEGTADANNGKDDVTFLVEVVKASIPKRLGRREGSKNRGMHCTVHWVGPTNPSGRRRRERLLHRTKTMKIDNKGDGDLSAASDDGSDEIEDCAEHIFTVDDDNLFLFRTTMKQLVNASVRPPSPESSKGEADLESATDDGGLRFDIFEKPRDMLNSVYSTVLAGNISEKEANAVARESSSFTSYRLVGSVFLPSEEFLSNCDERRFERDLIENWRKMQQQQGRNPFQRKPSKKADGGRLALRIRLASEFDVAFAKSLALNPTSSGGVNAALRAALIRYDGDEKPEAELVTEVDENVLTAESSIKAMSNISPMAQESVRYLFSNDTEKRLLVKPYPDPSRIEETTWFTEEGLQNECYKPSTNWIQAGQAGSCSLGRVFLEVLECRGLPNTDAGGSIGNKTDAFISIVYRDIMVQTEVIDDSCSPMWMPWTSRAFIFEMGHPSTSMYIGVTDYDIGPAEHECIGRVAIRIGKLTPQTLYTLTYNLYESSNLTEKGEDMGTITVRLRVEIPDEKKFLMEGWRAPERKWVNSQQWKSHRVAKYCVDGPHDEEVFEMRLFRSHINELLTQKRYLTYAISDAISSLLYWRGQVKIGNVWLPLHSAMVYYFSIHVVENPQFLPSSFLFGLAWIMIVNMLQKSQSPNPWHRGKSFAYHWSVLSSSSNHTAAEEIHPMEGHKEAIKVESMWKQRLADDDEQYAKQAELDAKIKEISDDAVIRTKAQANSALVDPISAVAGARLLPYQQRLSRYCNQVRYVRNIMNWEESILAFFFTLIFLGAGFVALFIPWRFILLWTSRLIVWVFLGPWMRLWDLFHFEETESKKAKASVKTMKLFVQQQKIAKILRENALKMKPFRVKLFGKFITRLPEFNLTRHEDVPLPESSAEPYTSEEPVKPLKFVISQDLSGTMIPQVRQDAAESSARRQKEKEYLVSQYQKMLQEKPELESAPEDTLAETFELIGTEDRVLCLHTDTSEGDTVDTDKLNLTEMTPTRSASERDVSISDKAIQSALEKELKELHTARPPKTKWIFSAQFSLSLRKETITGGKTPLLCNGATNPTIGHHTNDLIEDCVQEEGVEVVPFLDSASNNNGTLSDAMTNNNGILSDAMVPSSNGNGVSIFYVKDDIKHEVEGTQESIDDENEGGGNDDGKGFSEDSEGRNELHDEMVTPNAARMSDID